MSNLKIRKGDTVQIMTGKDRGKSGKVLEVRAEDNRALVEGINLVSRHKRPKTARDKGQKMIKPAALDISNIMLVCASCGKPSRVSMSVADNGDKTRICKSCNQAI